MAAHCGFDVTIMQAHWADCWNAGEIGDGLLQGWYHGCMTYTHATGVRNRYLEFSNSWAMLNKPSGLIAKLDDAGKPMLSPLSDLDGVTVVDVTGWAPTADTLHFVKNQCTDTKYTGFTVVQGDEVENVTSEYTLNGPNDRALAAVLADKAHAMWIYADQAYNYHCASGVTQAGWSCDLWNTFGTKFAFIQVGMFGWMYNGTTVVMTKKGAGVASYIDTCLESFHQTQGFLDTCKIMHSGHNQMQTCVPNDLFAADADYAPASVATSPWMFPTKDMKDGGKTCSDGYCNCDELPTPE